MADILLFTPKPELDAKANLEGFIALVRDRLTVFGADFTAVRLNERENRCKP